MSPNEENHYDIIPSSYFATKILEETKFYKKLTPREIFIYGCCLDAIGVKESQPVKSIQYEIYLDDIVDFVNERCAENKSKKIANTKRPAINSTLSMVIIKLLAIRGDSWRLYRVSNRGRGHKAEFFLQYDNVDITI